MRRGFCLGIVVALAGAVAPAGSAGAGGTAGLTYITHSGMSQPVVWAANANGTSARKIGHGEQPLLSPNGQFVAAVPIGSHAPGIAIYSTSGGKSATYLPGATFEAAPLAWSPDSRYLAVALFDPVSHGIGKSSLVVIDTTGGTAVMVAHGIVSGASFSGGSGPATVFYGLFKKSGLNAPVDIYSADPAGATPPTKVTHDGHSLNPLWTVRGIVFDRQRLRKEAPENQIFVLHGGTATQITNIKVDQLSEGLVPIAASADGTKLAAEYEGQDNSEGWAVNLVSHQAKLLATNKNGLVDAGISRNGKTLLVDLGIFGGDPSSKGKVATIPFGGGKPKTLVTGNEPTWNQ